LIHFIKKLSDKGYMKDLKRILIAEDEAVNRIYFSRVLGKEGFSVDEAANGEEAVNKALQCSYDLILMDLMMPIINGLKATEIIRNSEADLNRHTPIIALTSHSYPDDVDRCKAVGMDEFLPKPLNNRKLLDTVNKYL